MPENQETKVKVAERRIVQPGVGASRPDVKAEGRVAVAEAVKAADGVMLDTTAAAPPTEAESIAAAMESSVKDKRSTVPVPEAPKATTAMEREVAGPDGEMLRDDEIAVDIKALEAAIAGGRKVTLKATTARIREAEASESAGEAALDSQSVVSEGVAAETQAAETVAQPPAVEPADVLTKEEKETAKTEEERDLLYARKLRRLAEAAALRASDQSGILSGSDDPAVLLKHGELVRQFGREVPLAMAYTLVKADKLEQVHRDGGKRKQSDFLSEEVGKQAEASAGVTPAVVGAGVARTGKIAESPAEVKKLTPRQEFKADLERWWSKSGGGRFV